MSVKTHLRKVGNSYGIILPKEVVHALKVKEGDALYITEAAEGAIRVSPAEPGFTEKMEVADDLMRRYRNALRELAR